MPIKGKGRHHGYDGWEPQQSFSFTRRGFDPRRMMSHTTSNVGSKDPKVGMKYVKPSLARVDASSPFSPRGSTVETPNFVFAGCQCADQFRN